MAVTEPGVGARCRIWVSIGCVLLGMAAVVVALQWLPPAPAFSPTIGRINHWQSYENSYFASLRSFDALVRDSIKRGEIPIVAIGDSTIRGVGANSSDAWTQVLQRKLSAAGLRCKVLNFAQNGGDVMAPLLFHHLCAEFPEALFIIQWHFGSELSGRTQFHYWLTSEIALRDGDANPAVKEAFGRAAPTEDERLALFMAALNIGTNYLDVGNWIRYRWLGIWDYRKAFLGKWVPFLRKSLRGIRHLRVGQLTLTPLSVTPDEDSSIADFKPNPALTTTLSEIFAGALAQRGKYIRRPLDERLDYLDRVFPPSVRSRLLLLTLDMNPHYMPAGQEEWLRAKSAWDKLRADMEQCDGLHWLALSTPWKDWAETDFVDLGHLNVRGQRKLADAVAAWILSPQGWAQNKIR